MRKHQADKQCFLLAGGTTLRLHRLFAVMHDEIGPVRPLERAPCAGIAIAALCQHRRVIVLEVDRGARKLSVHGEQPDQVLKHNHAVADYADFLRSSSLISS